MATLPLSVHMGSHCLSCRAFDSSKLVAATHCNYAKSVRQSSRKIIIGTNMVWEGVAKNGTKLSYQNHRLKVLGTLRASVAQTTKTISTYRFMTEVGGQVKVFVENKDNNYRLYVEASSLQLCGIKEELVMSWGIFRSDSLSFIPLDIHNSGSNGKTSSTDTPLMQKSSGGLAVELDFEASLAPFYVSFLLKSPLVGDSKSSEIRSHRKTNFCVPVGFRSGYPFPLGLSFSADGSMNFALFSRSSENVLLCLYDDTTTDKPAIEIDLDPYVNRTGDIWHASMDSTLPFMGYGYRCKGVTREGDCKHNAQHVLLDPYAKIIADFIPAQRGSGLHLNCLGKLCKEPTFDWSSDVRPYLPLEKLVVYRLNVRHFTEDKSSKLPVDIGGTFSGITEKLQHFKDIGVNAILLEPICHFDVQKGPYFPLHFFSPSNLYETSDQPGSAISSMKEMVKRLHANGIEVFLEVVFTHTAESGALGEIDYASYYYVEGGENLRTRNALKCNFPIVQQMILDSLRYWVIEFRIDGFCFVDALSLLRGVHGEYLSRPPLVEAIAFDPLLSKVKIIADPWDLHEMVPKEIQFPHWKRWAEINTKFCDGVRNFLRGEGLLSSFATRLCGSGDIFLSGRGPAFSFNFVARNFGLPLVDLVSFSSSEIASQLSWNCGEEGLTNKAAVLEKRLKQIRNFLFILFISQGVPILNMGDECGLSSGGSPEYVDRKPLNWNALETGFGIQTKQFISFLTSLRTRRSDILQRRNFLKEENIEWQGSDQSPPQWDNPSSKFLALILKADADDSQSSSEPSSVGGDLFVAFNSANNSETVTLPPPPAEMAWLRLVDTAIPYPGFFSAYDDSVLEQLPGLATYEIKSHSCVLFEAGTPRPQMPTPKSKNSKNK